MSTNITWYEGLRGPFESYRTIPDDQVGEIDFYSKFPPYAKVLRKPSDSTWTAHVYRHHKNGPRMERTDFATIEEAKEWCYVELVKLRLA